jgi:hypothetical protein
MNKLNLMFGKKTEDPLKESTKESVRLSHEHTNQKHGYQCPMKCEGDKVYKVPGNCPVCNMKLVPVAGSKPQGHHVCC